MDKVIASLKNLYRGENVVKKHLLFTALLVMPAIASSAFGLIDKDTPSEIKIVLAVIGILIFVLSIIPMFIASGFGLNFITDRYSGSNEGIPEVKLNQLTMGIKVFPLHIVWGIYGFILFGGLYTLAFLPVIITPSALSILLMILLIILATCSIFLITPFFSHIIIQYSKDYKYTSALFNPLTVIDFIKKSFVPTVITSLKYLLVGIIFSVLGGVIYGIIALILICFGVIVTLMLSNVDKIEYTPIFIAGSILLSGIACVCQAYLSSIVGFAYWTELIDVYKEKIDKAEETV